jgi:hypothetical protein
MQDKHLLTQASSGLKEKTKQFKQLEWDYQVLQNRCEQVSFVSSFAIPYVCTVLVGTSKHCMY